jgi:CelD/BcsL family acetyltransferase involved in cellulose biosynthesis
MSRALEVGPLEDRAEWDRLWRACPWSTHFHSRCWAESWEAAGRGAMRPAPLRATFADGAEAILPLSLESRRGGLMRRRHSSPGGTYGGWLAAEPLGRERDALLARHMAGALGDLSWRVNPYGDLGYLDVLEGAATEETQAVPLAAGIEAVVRSWTKGHRSAAGKAEREGVTVAVAGGDDEWRAFAAMHADSVRRWGDAATVTHPPGLPEELRRRGGDDVRLWLARYEGQPVAGALCLYAGRHVSYWMGAALESHFHVRPVHLLLREAMADACGAGLEWFDLNPSGGHAGVEAFKKGFGAERLPAPLVTVTGARSRALSAARGLLRRPGGGAAR